MEEIRTLYETGGSVLLVVALLAFAIREIWHAWRRSENQNDSTLNGWMSDKDKTIAQQSILIEKMAQEIKELREKYENLLYERGKEAGERVVLQQVLNNFSSFEERVLTILEKKSA